MNRLNHYFFMPLAPAMILSAVSAVILKNELEAALAILWMVLGYLMRHKDES